MFQVFFLIEYIALNCYKCFDKVTRPTYNDYVLPKNKQIWYGIEELNSHAVNELTLVKVYCWENSPALFAFAVFLPNTNI